METKPSAPRANDERKRNYLFKVVVVGESATGKTAIRQRCSHNYFQEDYKSTIGIDFAQKIIEINDDITIRAQFWDINGKELSRSMTRVYYREAVGCIIAFDVTRPSTFDAVSKWKSSFDSKVQLPDGSPVPCILLANKCDLAKNDLFNNVEEMDNYCRDQGFLKCFETSAKENINIEIAIRYLIDEMVKNTAEMHDACRRMKPDDHPSKPTATNGDY